MARKIDRGPSTSEDLGPSSGEQNEFGFDYEIDSLGKYEKFEPLLSGLKLTDKTAVWMTTAMIYRRIVRRTDV